MLLCQAFVVQELLASVKRVFHRVIRGGVCCRQRALKAPAMADGVDVDTSRDVFAITCWCGGGYALTSSPARAWSSVCASAGC